MLFQKLCFAFKTRHSLFYNQLIYQKIALKIFFQKYFGRCSESLLVFKIIRLFEGINNLNMNINDPKYQSLRKKLDELGYTQTLHPDSIQLVERLYKDQLKALCQVEKERKKNKKESEIDKSSNSMIFALQTQIEKLQKQNEYLQKQIESLKSNSVINIPQERTLKLQAKVNDLVQRIQQQIQQFTLQKQELQGTIEDLKLKSERDNKELSIERRKSAKLKEENQQFSNMVEKKVKQMNSCEEANSKNRIKIQILQKTIEDLKNTAKNTRDEGKDQSGRMTSILKKQLAEIQSKYRQIKAQLQSAIEQNDDLRRQLRRAKDQIASNKIDESKNKSLDSISKAGIQKLQALLQQTQQQLRDRSEQVRRLKDEISDNQSLLDKSNNKIKQLNQKLQFLSQQNDNLQSQIQVVSGKLTTSVKKVRELQNTSSSYQKQLKQYMENAKNTSYQKLQKSIEEEQIKNDQLKKQLVMNQRQYKILQQQLKILRQQSQQRTLQRDKATFENKKLSTIISQGNKNLQLLQIQKQELMKENRDLKVGKQQIASSENASKSELFLLKQNNQALQVEIQDLRGAIHSLQATNVQQQSQIIRMQKILNQSEDKNKEIFQDNRQMVSRLSILQQRKNQLHEKVKQLQQRDQNRNESTTVTKKQYDRLIVEYQQLQNQLNKKDQAIRLLDCERDQLQNVLDKETQENALLRDEIENIKRQTRKYGKQIDQQSYNLNDLNVKISRLQSQRDDLDKQLHRQCQENLQLKDRLSMAEVTIRQLQNQVNNLAISNKQNEREVQRSRVRVTQLDRKLKEKIKDYEEERQRATALNILNNELHADMQRQRSQIIRLQGFMKELEDANNSMYFHLENKDQELQHCARLIADSQKQENQYRLEIQSNQRQLQNITQDYQYVKAQLKQINGDREALRAQRNWKKDISAQSEDWRFKQQQRYLQLQQDYDRKKYQVEQLRQKLRQVQSLLVDERAKSFKMSRQIESSQVTPAKTILVQSRVQSYHSENENISNVHSRARNISLQNIRDDVSQRSETNSAHSTIDKIKRLQEQYLQTTIPNMRS